MATNLDLDDALINKAVKLGKFKSKKEAVNAAVAEFVRRRSQAGLLKLAGKVDYLPDYDYKALRARKRG